MKKKPLRSIASRINPAPTAGVRNVARKVLFTKTPGRLAAILAMALLAAATVATLAFAQATQKPKKAKSVIESKRMNATRTTRGVSRKGEHESLFESSADGAEGQQGPIQIRGPFESHLTKAHEFNGDLRSLPR